MYNLRRIEGWYDGRPVASGSTPPNPSSARSRSSTRTSMTRTGLSSPIQSSTHSGNSVLWPRSALSMKRFIRAPRKSCGNHIARITSSAAFSHSQGHVWTAPGWQGLSSRLQHWSVQPCVRPLGAVHMTAGHNALRGSGPNQTDAFNNALTQVGCPDRRIDRLCNTCCPPSPTYLHITPSCPARFRLSRKRDGFLVSLAPGHHGPDHPRDLVGERDSRNLGRPPGQQGREPGPVFGAVDLGVADDRKRAGHKQAAQIAVTLLAYIAEPVLASSGVLFRYHTDPGREVAP